MSVTDFCVDAVGLEKSPDKKQGPCAGPNERPRPLHRPVIRETPRRPRHPPPRKIPAVTSLMRRIDIPAAVFSQMVTNWPCLRLAY